MTDRPTEVEALDAIATTMSLTCMPGSDSQRLGAAYLALREREKLVRAEAIEECAKICDKEAEKRYMRSEVPWPGDERMVQGHKGVTAHSLAVTIRALPAAPTAGMEVSQRYNYAADYSAGVEQARQEGWYRDTVAAPTAAAQSGVEMPPDEEWLKRCDWCNWPLKETIEEGCTADNCSQRPLPLVVNDYPFKYRRYARALRAAALSAKPGGEMLRSGLYVASRTNRATLWRDMRTDGFPITSSWIDEAGEGETADFGELWKRIQREIAGSRGLLFYANTVDAPWKGAFVEVGMALALGVPVGVVIAGELEGRTLRPVGSWLHDKRVTQYETLGDAFKLMLAAAPES